MNIFVALLFLFALGSIIGWVIELFYRRLISANEWINPGFLVGPYVPLYGFGICIFYLLSNIPINGILDIITMALTVTLVEYVGGIIFIKGMGIKLWDYSERWGNINGLICPLYTLLWGILGAIYYYFAHTYIVMLLEWLDGNSTFLFILGFFYGVFAVDFAYSSQLLVKVRRFAKEKNLVVKYEELKDTIFNQAKLNKEKYSFLFAMSNNVKKIEEHINTYIDAQAERTQELKRNMNFFIKNKVKPKNKKLKGKKDKNNNTKTKE